MNTTMAEEKRGRRKTRGLKKRKTRTPLNGFIPPICEYQLRLTQGRNLGSCKEIIRVGQSVKDKNCTKEWIEIRTSQSKISRLMCFQYFLVSCHSLSAAAGAISNGIQPSITHLYGNGLKSGKYRIPLKFLGAVHFPAYHSCWWARR